MSAPDNIGPEEFFRAKSKPQAEQKVRLDALARAGERSDDPKTRALGKAARRESAEIEAALAALAELPPVEYDIRRDDEAKRLKIRKGTLDEEVKKRRTRKGDRDDAEEKPDIAALARSAADIIASQDVLSRFIADLAHLVAGEERIGKLLYLIATSRLFRKPMSGAVKGVSASGKSEIREHVLEFFPPEDVIAFTTMSEKALLYEPRDFRHRILSMAEAVGFEEASLQDYLIRELISSGVIRYPVVSKIGQNLETTVIEKHGPVAFIVTTTRRRLHPENETRLISLETDDSREQTERVLAKVANIEGENHVAAKIDFRQWHNFQRLLKAENVGVVIPYAGTLARLVPARAVRLRRDFGQVLRAIKAHALLHYTHRRRADGVAVADIEHDYRAVRDLTSDLLAEAVQAKIRKTIRETVEAVSRLEQPLAKGDPLRDVSSAEVARALKIDISAARRRLGSAIDEGFVVNLETRTRQPGRFRTTGQSLDVEDVLPTVETLTQKLAGASST